MFVKITCFICGLLLVGSLFCSYAASSAEKPPFQHTTTQISLSALNNEPMVYLPNPDVPTVKVPMTSSLAYETAVELLKNDNGSKARTGTEFMIHLFNEKYGPAVDLFDNICDIRGDTGTKNIETIEKTLREHFTIKQKRLGGWEEEDE